MNDLLIREGLFLLFKETAQNPDVRYCPTTWEKAYETSCNRIARLADGEPSAYVMRVINLNRIEIEALDIQIKSLQNIDPATKIYSLKMLEMLQAEMRLLMLKITHPELYHQHQAPVSPLHLNDEYHITDFVEIITPFFELGFFKTVKSDPARLKAIISVFEWAFNISIPNYSILRAAALNRKIHLTPLLDKMKEVMIRLSQE